MPTAFPEWNPHFTRCPYCFKNVPLDELVTQSLSFQFPYQVHIECVEPWRALTDDERRSLSDKLRDRRDAAEAARALAATPEDHAYFAELHKEYVHRWVRSPVYTLTQYPEGLGLT